MPVIDFHKKEINFKIVYYGPGLSGKTTNIEQIHKQTKPKFKGKLISLATQTDRTLFFDFLPMELGEMGGYKIRLHLYTVPGQVHYNATRKLVLKGVDGIVFVADSQSTMKDANIESLLNLERNLRSYGKNLKDLPHLIQGNKRDLDGLTPMEDLRSILNRYNAPMVEAVATEGPGVLDTLREVVKMVMKASRTQLPDDASDEVIADPESEEEITSEREQLAEPVVVMSEEAESIPAERETSREISPVQPDDMGAPASRTTDGTILDLEVPIPGGGRLELKLGIVARVLKSSTAGKGEETVQKVELTIKPLQGRIPEEGPAQAADMDNVAEGAIDPSPEAVLEPVPDELPVEELTDPLGEAESGYDPSYQELEITDPAETAEMDAEKDTGKKKKGILGLFGKKKK